MFGLKPVEMFSINDFRFIDAWNVSNGTAQTLSFQLTKTDSLGERRFILPTGGSVQVVLMRARAASVNSVAQTITKTCTANPEDKSMFSFSLSAEETKQVLSGGLQLNVTISGSLNSVNIPYVIRKNVAAPGY